MPPLTAEQRRDLIRKVGEIETMYAGNCAFRYHQSEELRKTWAYRKSGGVCYAMSLDWLRRRMWNVYNPAMKAKRNFDAPKYTARRKKRVALTIKHGKLQDAYARQIKVSKYSSVGTVLGQLVATGLVSSGMDSLVTTQLGTINSYDISEQAWAATENSPIRMGAPNAHYAFRHKLTAFLNTGRGRLSPTVPAVGVFITMDGDDGHAVALFLQAGQEAFFDPNLGEYTFGTPAERQPEQTFVTTVWFDIYHRFLEMDAIGFTLVTYPAPAQDDEDSD